MCFFPVVYRYRHRPLPRDKLHMFEGNGSSTVKDKCGGNRSSIGALNGRGLVSTWSEVRNTPVGRFEMAFRRGRGWGESTSFARRYPVQAMDYLVHALKSVRISPAFSGTNHLEFVWLRFAVLKG